LSTWLPEGCPVDTEVAATFEEMNAQYLMLIEQLVREGRSEREIENIVEDVVEEDVALDDGLDDLRPAA
jgi:uncharacterized membrane-anchored protein